MYYMFASPTVNIRAKFTQSLLLHFTNEDYRIRPTVVLADPVCPFFTFCSKTIKEVAKHGFRGNFLDW